MALFVLIGYWGRLSIHQKIKKLNDKRQFLESFVSHFSDYLESQLQDFEAYGWLMNNVDQMSLQVGNLSFVRYQNAHHIINNLNLWTQGIPLIAQLDPNHPVDRQQIGYLSRAIMDACFRYEGGLNTLERQYLTDSKRVLAWYREGIGNVLSLPLMILTGLGLLSETQLDRLQINPLFLVIKSLLALFTVIATIIGFLTDVPQLIEMVRGWVT